MNLAAIVRTVAVLVLLSWPVVGGAGAPIHPMVLAQTADGARTDFFVVLGEQADLSPAADLPTKQDKGRFVVEALRRTADASQAEIRALLDARGVAFRSFYIVNAILVTGDGALVEELAARPEVDRIEANPEISNPLPEPTGDRADAPQGIEWNVAKIGAPDAWALGFTGQGIVVGGADTGIDWDHPALKGNYRGWNGITVNHDYSWHDAVHSGGGVCGADSTEPCDDHGHGTHTIGTAVGTDGGSNQIGVAPGARWIGCRNMNQGNGTPATYMECMEWFLAPYPIGGTPAQGDPSKAPDVTNNSWNCTPSEGCSWETLRLAVEAQRAAGILMVVSAGNSGPSCSTVSEPAAIYDASYTVGSTTSTDAMSGFSSRGPATANQGNPTLNKPDIAAPGSSIRSSYPGGTYQGGWSGTSMAAPHVAGAAAILWSARPELIGNPGGTEAVLNAHALRLPGIVEGCGGNYVLGPNNTWGHGRLDIASAVTSAITLAPAGLSISELNGNGSGVIEPGEWATVAPSWHNTSDLPATSISGGLTSTSVQFLSSTASYGTIPAGATVSCSASNDCYLLRSTAARPSTHWDLVLHETLSSSEEYDWTLHLGGSFSDVPVGSWAYSFVETVLHNGITSGCGAGLYCPAATVTRWQMAVFIALARAGGADIPTEGTIPGKGDFDCSPGGTSVFADVPPDDAGCRHVHAIAASGITAGCGSDAYCPSGLVTRWQMAVFMARAMLDGTPIPTTGSIPGLGPYDCSLGGSSVFTDISPDDPGCPAVHYLAAQQVTAGCGGGDYCPADAIARDQMSVFLTKAFALELD